MEKKNKIQKRLNPEEEKKYQDKEKKTLLTSWSLDECKSKSLYSIFTRHQVTRQQVWAPLSRLFISIKELKTFLSKLTWSVWVTQLLLNRVQAEWLI